METISISTAIEPCYGVNSQVSIKPQMYIDGQKAMARAIDFGLFTKLTGSGAQTFLTIAGPLEDVSKFYTQVVKPQKEFRLRD